MFKSRSLSTFSSNVGSDKVINSWLMVICEPVARVIDLMKSCVFKRRISGCIDLFKRLVVE